jgi:hypothetical protein
MPTVPAFRVTLIRSTIRLGGDYEHAQAGELDPCSDLRRTYWGLLASSDSSSSISVLNTTCTPTFDLHSLPSPAAANPAQAVADFLQHGSIAQPGFGVQNPVHEGFPSAGWEQSDRGENSATFRSDGSTFQLTRAKIGT